MKLRVKCAVVESQMFKLVISDDEGQKTVVPLLRDEVTIGREEGNTIRLTERNVSRAHARLRRQSDTYVIEDLGSYNGIVINGERLESEIQLSAGDRVAIGDYALAFESDADRVSKPPPSVRPSAPPPRFVILGEPAPGAEFALRRPVVRIGRDDRLDIPIYHKSISHEHAEVQLKDGKVTIFDLESLNGIRVNGVQTSRAVLEAGDEIEIGAVRLQFFAQEARTNLQPLHKVEAASANASYSKTAPVGRLAAAALGLVLLGGGAAFFLMSESGEPGFDSHFDFDADSIAAAPTLETPSPDGGEPARVPEATDVYPPQPEPDPIDAKEARAMAREAKTSCRKALRSGDWEEALSHARFALRMSPQDKVARDCMLAAREGIGDSESLAEAERELAADRVESAYALLTALPKRSPLRKTPQFAEVRSRYVAAHQAYGARALRLGQADKAKREASLILEIPGISTAERKAAKALQNRARRAPSQSRSELAANEPSPQTASAVSAKPDTKPDPKPTQTADTLQQARECLARGDNACVIRLLEGGGAQNASALALLIETYRATGNQVAARRHMGWFVTKYPSNSRAERYRKMLGED